MSLTNGNVSQHKSVCIAGCTPHDQRILRQQLQRYSYEIIIFEQQVPPPVISTIIIVDCQHLDRSRITELQTLLSINNKAALIFLGQVTDKCEFALRRHSGKIYHLQSGIFFLEDLQEALDEINVPHPKAQWSLLQIFRRKIFKLYGFEPSH